MWWLWLSQKSAGEGGGISILADVAQPVPLSHDTADASFGYKMLK